jgi:hypothetical protein
MSLNQLVLEFYGSPPELYRTRFTNMLGDKSWSMRGRIHSDVYGGGSFHWTSAVKALSLLLVGIAKATTLGEPVDLVRLSGQRGSLARSLDYALSKQPEWVLQMFGFDCNGQAYLRRLLRRNNPEMKRAGPVMIGINPNTLLEIKLEIQVNGRILKDGNQLMKLTQALEESFGDTLYLGLV